MEPHTSKSQLKPWRHEHLIFKSRNQSPKRNASKPKRLKCTKKKTRKSLAQPKSVKKKKRRKMIFLKKKKGSMRIVKPVQLFEEPRPKLAKKSMKESRKKSQIKSRKHPRPGKKPPAQKVFHCKEGAKPGLKKLVKKNRPRVDEENIVRFFNKMKKLKKENKLKPLSQSRVGRGTNWKPC